MAVEVDNRRARHILHHLRHFLLVLDRDFADDVHRVFRVNLQVFRLLDQQVHRVVARLDRADFFASFGRRLLSRGGCLVSLLLLFSHPSPLFCGYDALKCELK